MGGLVHVSLCVWYTYIKLVGIYDRIKQQFLQGKGEFIGYLAAYIAAGGKTLSLYQVSRQSQWQKLRKIDLNL